MKYFLRADIIPCKGYNRTILMDILNSEIAFLNSSYFETLYELYHNGLKIVDSHLLKMLKESDYLIECDVSECYPRINLNNFFESVFLIDNCIIDRNQESSYDIIKLLEQLDNLNCKYIQLRYFNYNDEVYDLINFLNFKKSFIQNVEIIIEKIDVNFPKLEELFYGNLRVNKLILTNSTKTDILDIKDGRVFIEVENKISDCKSCGNISNNNFYINKINIKESFNHNSCLHKKISIDKDGNIKNCPSMQQSFGNIKDTTLEEALNHPDFKKYWNVNKDMIAVCKDCEFRHICTDCRAYTERTHFEEDIDLSNPLKCGYNPYTNEWAEWSTNPLKQKAIEYYGMQELVKKDA